MKKKNQPSLFIVIFAVFFLILLAAGINLAQKNAAKKAVADINDKITISFEKQGLIPFEVMTIQGKNLDPEAATSVIFDSFSQQTLIIPALAVTPTTVEVAVPPLSYSTSSGKFNLDVISFTVIQVKKVDDKLSVKSSNKVTGIQVLAPITPSVVGSGLKSNLPPGAITRAFVDLAIKRLDNLSGQIVAENSNLSEPFGLSRQIMEELLVELDGFVKDPKRTIELRALDGTAVGIKAAEIAWLDAYFAGFLGQVEKQQLLVKSDRSFSLIPVALAAGSPCGNNWQSKTDAVEKLGLQLDCLNEKINNKMSTIITQDNFRYWQILDDLSLSIFVHSIELKQQLSFALTRYFTGLNPVMTNLIKRKPLPPQVQIAYLLGEVLYESNKVCSADPKFCYERNFAFGDPFNAKEIIFMQYGIPQSEEDRFKTPAEFENWLFDQHGLADGSYDVRLLPPESEPLPKYNPIPKTKPSPAPVPSPKPTTPEPIEYIPSSPSPSPAPVVVPTPAPVIKDCWELKEEAYDSCRANCSESQVCYDDYSLCSAGTCNIYCVNDCQSTLRKCLDASSKCFSDCNNANYAYKCN